MTLRLDSWLDKHWQQALHQHGDCVFVQARSGASLRSAMDHYCLNRDISPLRWRMCEQDGLEPYSPLLPLLRSLIQRRKFPREQLLDRLGLKGTERELVQDYFCGREIHRIEQLLPDDLSFQAVKFRQMLINLLGLLSEDKPVMLLVTGLQYAGPTALQLLEDLIKTEQTGHFLLVIGMDPGFQHKNEARQHLWEQWFSQTETNGLVYSQSLTEIPTPFISWPCFAEQGPLAAYAALTRCEQLLDLLCFPEAVTAAQQLMQQVELGILEADQLYQWQLQLCLGRSLLFSRDYEEALASYDRLLDLAQSSNDSARLCTAYREIALVHIFRSDPSSAIRYSQLAVKLCATDEGSLLQTQALFCHFVACDKANVPFGFARLRSLLQQLEQQHMVRGQIYVLRNLYAQVPFEEKLDHHTALDCTLSAIRLAREYNNQADLAAAFHSCGVVYNQMNRYRRALRCFRISEKIREKLNVPGELARIRNGIGYFLCQRENYAEAHRYYLSSLNTVLRLNDFSEITVSLYNLAWLYTEVKENSSANLVLGTLREMLRIRGNSCFFPFKNLHDVFLLQGMIHLQQGEWVRAEQDLKRSYKLDINLSSEGQFMRPFLEALLEEQQGHWQAALDKLHHVAGQHLFNLHHEILLHEAAIRICLQLKLRWDAFSHLQRALQVCDQFQFPVSKRRILCVWRGHAMPKQQDPLSPPRFELDQLLHIVRQEQRMNQLWQQVHEMRLLATLQQLAANIDSEGQIAAETLRLICMHFNAQAGFLLVKQGHGMQELANYSQVSDTLPLQGQQLSQWLNNHSGSRLSFNGEIPIGHHAIAFSSLFSYPLMENQQQLGEMILLTFADSAPLDKSDRDILQFIGNQLSGQLINIRQRRQLIALSSTDALTGLFNRQHFQTLLKTELRRIARFGIESPYLSLSFIDLDNFKYYNDTFGHDMGDQLLCWFAELLRGSLRDFDVACRWGGDEFLVLLPHTRANEAMHAMRRVMRRLLEKQGFAADISQHLGHRVSLPESCWLNCSIGLTDSLNLSSSLDDAELLQQADALLYEVKRNGKGQILFKKAARDNSQILS